MKVDNSYGEFIEKTSIFDPVDIESFLDIQYTEAEEI